ncbi:MAG: hypothetical protein GXP19_09985 [Gammaproteobacteria bacterium]|nr:hypothetical protein [Gammaproteobacteria bacterium]
MKKIFVLALAMLLASCQSMYGTYGSSPFSELPVNSTLTLNHKLVIPSGLAAAYIQDGRVILDSQVRVWQPNCKFEIRTIKDIPQIIKPDRFNITRFNLDTNLVSSNVIQLVSVGMLSVDGGGATAEIYITEMFLYSEKQPDVLRLSCQYWEDPQDGNYLSLLQVKNTLGDIIHFDH